MAVDTQPELVPSGVDAVRSDLHNSPMREKLINDSVHEVPLPPRDVQSCGKIVDNDRVIDGGGVRSTGDCWESAINSEHLSALRSRFLQRTRDWGLLKRCAQPGRKPVRGVAAAPRFSNSEIHSLRRDVQEFLQQSGLKKSMHCVNGQPFALDLLEGLLEVTCDVDSSLPGQLRKGVPSGIRDDIPPSGVFHREPKNKSAARISDILACEENWSSAEDDVALTSDLLKMEMREGFLVEVRGTIQDLKAQYNHVGISKLAVIKALNKDPRLVVDATASGLNGNARFPEVCEYPTIASVIELIARYYARHSEPLHGVSLDVKSAHKRILINPGERELHHVLFQDKLLRYNTCHFGGAWSAYWWARSLYFCPLLPFVVQ